MAKSFIRVRRRKRGSYFHSVSMADKPPLCSSDEWVAVTEKVSIWLMTAAEKLVLGWRLSDFPARRQVRHRIQVPGPPPGER
ncbi:hypothetical protein [Chimaeribacter californicus]|uniref:hypothetical protein n=1 Tax=Chimaeribacter californicus TaxID=2060067 RepID=UPI0013FCFF36|nr:hypothetical protein [Chimaeribacter californicus]